MSVLDDENCGVDTVLLAPKGAGLRDLGPESLALWPQWLLGSGLVHIAQDITVLVEC